MKFLKIAALFLLLGATFAGGYVFRAAKAPAKPVAVERKILHYVDPMHPEYTSDKPGIAPDCGMQLEPVYADGEPGTTGTARAVPDGAFKVSPERQQLIGVKFMTVESAGATRAIRTVGKVAADETRIGHVHTRV